MKIAVIGTGNGGQATAGHLAALGHEVWLYGRNAELVRVLDSSRHITLTGALELQGSIHCATTDIGQAVSGASLVLVVTTAPAHAPLARAMAPYLSHGQVVVLTPGRTCGALEFGGALRQAGSAARVYLAEAQTLVYACRLVEPGVVHIIGVKDRVLLSALPASDTPHVIRLLSRLYSCYMPARNVLQTGFENIGAMFHPCVVLFNEAAIERGQGFYFYRDMTPCLARMIERVDAERLMVGKAYDLDLLSASDWVAYAYDGVPGTTLCERMQANPAYYEILAPTTIHCRQITEDIPTGILPMAELARAAGVSTPLFDSLVTMCSTLLDRDFRAEGRTLRRLGLDGLTPDQIIQHIER